MTPFAVTPAPILRKRKSLDEDPETEYMPTFQRVIKHPRRLERFQMDEDHSMSLPSFESAPQAPSMSASPASSPESSPTSEYPIFQLYPELPDPNAMDLDHSSPADSPRQDVVGLLGLEVLGDKHASCTQTPRLQIANYPGLEGRRAMYTQCMQCGGISQVNTL
ncbi:hypothetical protein DL93DRAFT_2072385 [Clavulina sp. PMI_390]|nr:hypothetical protein DL93DRAFT_2072385 [Clavulina sp. PMI_390]